ncbi:MAG: hypothetical protein EXR62_03090, partial [Chloroflexi bacterium]|nr:hypothetical protein [Chloroflexota bacterium]
LLDDTYTKRYKDIPAQASWGVPGASPGQLQNPKDIKIGPDGNLYIADSSNGRVDIFDPQGKFISSFGSLGQAPEQLSEFWGLAVAADKTVYIADTWNHRISVWSPDGKYLRAFGGFADVQGKVNQDPGKMWGPRDIALDAQGNLYVTDTGNKRIQKFAQNGTPLAQFGGAGAGPGQFNEPVGIAIGAQSGDIFVVDTWNRRIQRFNKDFQFLSQWPVQGWEDEGVNNKPYLALDSQENVFVTDPVNSRILKFNNKGELLAVFGKAGKDASSMNLPTGVAVATGAAADKGDVLYVTDSFNQRILRFAPIP